MNNMVVVPWLALLKNNYKKYVLQLSRQAVMQYDYNNVQEKI